MTQEKREEADVTVEIIVEDFDMADYLPADHCTNDPDCTCAACTYPLN